MPLARWGAVALGFVGVFVACDPAELGISLPVLLVLAAAFLWGLSIVLLRKIAMQEKTIVQMILNNSFFLVTAGLPLIYLWQTPSLGQVALLFGAGSLAGFAQFALFEGMKRAPASVIAPFEYTALVWSFLLGYLIWGDVPRSGVFRRRLDDRRGRPDHHRQRAFSQARLSANPARSADKKKSKKSFCGMEPISGSRIYASAGRHIPPTYPTDPPPSLPPAERPAFFLPRAGSLRAGDRANALAADAA